MPMEQPVNGKSLMNGTREKEKKDKQNRTLSGRNTSSVA